MKILIQTKLSEAIRIDIGYETLFHSSLMWLTVTKEYYDKNGNVEYAEWLWGFLRDRHPERRKRKRWYTPSSHQLVEDDDEEMCPVCGYINGLHHHSCSQY